MPDRKESELPEPSAAQDCLDYFGPDPTGGRRSHINLWLALRMIREAIEDCAPPGSVPNDKNEHERLPDPTRQRCLLPALVIGHERSQGTSLAHLYPGTVSGNAEDPRTMCTHGE